VNDSPDCDRRIDKGFMLIVVMMGMVTGDGEAAEVTTILPL